MGSTFALQAGRLPCLALYPEHVSEALLAWVEEDTPLSQSTAAVASRGLLRLASPLVAVQL